MSKDERMNECDVCEEFVEKIRILDEKFAMLSRDFTNHIIQFNHGRQR